MAKKKTYPHKEYPVLGYRVTRAIYDDLTDQLDDMVDEMNKTLESHEKEYKKNDVFIRALKRGLNQIKAERGMK